MDSKLYEEQEIEIKELLVSVLRKWRVIVVFAFLSAIIFGGYKYYSGMNRIKDNKLFEEERKKIEINQNIYELNQNSHMKAMENLTKSLENQKKYLDNSILMNINPYYEFVAMASIFIDVGYQIIPGSIYQNIDYTNSIIGAYTALVNDSNNYKYIKEKTGLNTEIIYLKEIITIETKPIYDIIEDDYTNNNIMLIKVIHNEKEIAGNILTSIIEYLQDNKNIVTTSIGAHSFNIINTTEHTAVDINLADQQYKTMKILNNAEIELKSVKKAQNELIEPSQSLPNSKSIIINSVKFGVVGAFMITLAIVFFVVCGHLISNRLSNDKQLQKLYNINLLGAFSTMKERKIFGFIDRYIDSLDGVTERISEAVTYQIIATNIVALAGKSKVILLTGSIEDGELRKIQDSVANLLKNDDFTLLMARNLPNNADAIKKAMICDNIVIVEQRGKSKLTEIKSEIKAISNFDKNILGYIIK